jgi:hypothetical protein
MKLAQVQLTAGGVKQSNPIGTKQSNPIGTKQSNPIGTKQRRKTR